MRVAGVEYHGLKRIDGPLLFVEGIRGVAYDEIVEVTTPSGEERLGQVLDVTDTAAVVQVFGGTDSLSNADTRVRFIGRGLQVPASREMLGRVFDGLGRPKDGLPEVLTGDYRDVHGEPINPFSREYPRDFIQTGISSIDLMNTLVRGQKLPIFSGNGLPHNRIAAQIARQAKLLREDVSFAIVFAAMGVKYDVAKFFIDSFQQSGVITDVAMFLSLADDPSVERLVTPRSALTLAEYLAFEEDMHVLVIITDMTNYCESLREIATARSEIPSRKGYPGYLYSDLASMYERAGRLQGREGSITQMPILTMPSDDISHPIPDLTGYITEGQIVLERELFQKGVYPPVAGLPSLSRLMKDGIGTDRTRDDHPHVASQLFAAYSRVKDIRALASVIGEEELSPLDKLYIKFGDQFEQNVVAQEEFEDRSIGRSLEMGWEALKVLPRSELHRLSEEELQEHYDS
ncbi:MAG: V-type ATP synthase subunit B [Lentisphaerae bacterium]|jgi:V/A-type H+/Na+-transporting ATPase subunit B|nr:V-type ATP synthase subunit B [Lentisphaerota bacterium]MBT4822004.1 V-type ATP synthase subunit B [Lentisphaerota bacterium]MBT5609550.1 V-type ATP synthase subunit B [Lentisphaerota bacterium]MBT7058456.1 V-type ATP synthase subunit B [Lentisphaerota bacterium]MBT7843165.1 V-type ATP synthase subunit B [Lentisphaerota bacterium]